MKRYQSLALQELNIAVPGLRIRRLALHRHLPGVTAVGPHSHRYAQCLLYFTGHGRQRIGAREFQVQSGTAAFIPPHVEHAFHRAADRRPICLALELQWRGARRKPVLVQALSQSAFREVQQHLAALVRLQRQAPGQPALQIGAIILRILDLLLSELGMTPRVHAPAFSPVPVKVARVLESPDASSLKLGQLAQRAGYQRDHLNRLLKGHTGMTLGQMRAKILLARAERTLKGPAPVGSVASELGFGDANYFARWFRKQTGKSPTQWRRDLQIG